MEIWKNVKGFEDYQASNLGNVKSLKFGKERVLKQSVNKEGYLNVCLSKNNKKQKIRVHQLIAIAFLNHFCCGYKYVINHKNFIRNDNRLENLEVVLQRDNTNLKHIKSTSNYTGVSFCKSRNKWISQIWINGKQKNLGRFNTELEAHNAYQKELLNLTIFV